MRPSPAAAIEGNAARVQRKTPVRLTRSISSHSASSVASNFALCATPALLTRIARSRWRAMILSNAASIAVASPTSAVCQSQAVPISRAVCARRCASRPISVTVAPTATSRAAIARPMPRPPPVTTAWRPARGCCADVVIARHSREYSRDLLSFPRRRESSVVATKRKSLGPRLRGDDKDVSSVRLRGFRSHLRRAREVALELLLAGQILHRPPHVAIAELRRRVQRPVRVGEMRRSEEHTSELQSRGQIVCRLLLEKKNKRLVASEVAARELQRVFEAPRRAQP